MSPFMSSGQEMDRAYSTATRAHTRPLQKLHNVVGSNIFNLIVKQAVFFMLKMHTEIKTIFQLY